MLDCLILGDSIATGVAAALPRPACELVARVGSSSDWAGRHVPDRPYRTVAIATGTNDAQAPALGDRMMRLRGKVRAGHVLWILPYDRRAAGEVVRVARIFGDRFMDLAELPSRDRIHPRSYPLLARAVRLWGYAGRERSGGRGG